MPCQSCSCYEGMAAGTERGTFQIVELLYGLALEIWNSRFHCKKIKDKENPIKLKEP